MTKIQNPKLDGRKKAQKAQKSNFRAHKFNMLHCIEIDIQKQA